MSAPMLTPITVTKDIVTSVRKEANHLSRNDAIDWLKPFLDYRFLDNRVLDWLIFLGVLMVIYFLLKGIQHLLINRIAGWVGGRNDWLGFVGRCLKQISPLFFFAMSLSLAGLALHVSKPVAHVLTVLPVLALLAQLALFTHPLVNYLLDSYIQQRQEAGVRLTLRMMFPPLQFVGMVLVWSVLLLMGLDSLGFDITALVAGLGIGGVAVALAVQTILGDLLAAVSIVLDKPFVLGDFIVVGDFLGSVEYIGLKTTRLRSLSGELLVFPNSDILGSRIRNFKHMKERRVVVGFSVMYDTPMALVKSIPGWVKEIVVHQPALTKFDRAHLSAVDKSAYTYEVVFYVEDPDFNIYMDIQQAILFEIMDRFEQEGIRFAQPAQVLYMGGGGQPQAVEENGKAKLAYLVEPPLQSAAAS